MALGHDGDIFILAFDHRGSFKRKFGVGDDASAEEMGRLRDAKKLVYEGFLAAKAAGAPKGAGILVDEEMGADVARDAGQRGIPFAMPVEASGEPVFQFEYGDEFARHIDDFDPSWAKVLVRWNPGDPEEEKQTQGPRLRKLSDWLHDNGRRFLFELLVPATATDLARVEGDQERYDTEVRPDLTLRAIDEIQGQGIEPDVWKIEGLDAREDCERLARRIRNTPERANVVAVVLGRGADDARVDHWLRMGAPVEGYTGFAIGRSIWTDEVDAYFAKEKDREEAAAAIGANFRRFVDVYTGARDGDGED